MPFSHSLFIWSFIYPTNCNSKQEALKCLHLLGKTGKVVDLSVLRFKRVGLFVRTWIRQWNIKDKLVIEGFGCELSKWYGLFVLRRESVCALSLHRHLFKRKERNFIWRNTANNTADTMFVWQNPETAANKLGLIVCTYKNKNIFVYAWLLPLS